MKPIDSLTQQEQVILSLVARGWRSAKIAGELVISRRTVDNHVYHIFNKLGVSSRTEAVLYALQRGILYVNAGQNAQAGQNPEMSNFAQDAQGNPH